MSGGHIRQRSPGSWEVRYRAGSKTRTETVHGGKRDAQRRLRSLLTLADQGRHPEDPDRLTVGQWLARWLGVIKPELAAQTAAGYETTVRVHLIPAIGEIALARLSPANLQDFYSTLATSGLKPGTVRRISATLTVALNRAVELRLIAVSPAAAIKRRQPKNTVRVAPSVLDLAQCETLLAAAHASDIYVAVLLGIATGARRGEVLALRWGDIDLAGGEIHVQASVFQLHGQVGRKSTKSGEPRTVTISGEVVGELRRLKTEQAQHLLRLGVRQTVDTEVCARSDGTPPTPRGLSAAFRKLTKRCGLAAGFHMLRHSHASELLRLGVPVHAVAKRLGHRDGGALLLKTYAHVTDAVARDAAERLGPLFSKL